MLIDENMDNNYNILYISYYPWSNHGSRYTNLALALSDNRYVENLLFVNPLGSIGEPHIFIKDRSEICNLCLYRRILKNPIEVYRCIAPIPFKESFISLKKLYNIWFEWSFGRLISKLHNKRGLLFIQTPSEEALAMLSIAKGDNILTIFDWADLFEMFAGSDIMRNRIEFLCKEIATRADFVFCVSPYLKNIALTYNKNSFLSPNAVSGDSITNVTPSIRDKDARLKNPSICYYGLINPVKLNYRLIKEMADTKPKWRFVFIGPHNNPMNTNEKFKGSNIELIEPMDKYQLHKYIRDNVDICFNPYSIDDKPNNASSPMKLYETLGDGLPFVSTDAFDPLDAKGLISMGKNAKEMISKIEYELESDSLEKRAQRISYARNNTWEIRACEMIRIISIHTVNKNNLDNSEYEKLYIREF
jgi:hypothetical protein